MAIRQECLSEISQLFTINHYFHLHTEIGVKHSKIPLCFLNNAPFVTLISQVIQLSLYAYFISPVTVLFKSCLTNKPIENKRHSNTFFTLRSVSDHGQRIDINSTIWQECLLDISKPFIILSFLFFISKKLHLCTKISDKYSKIPLCFELLNLKNLLIFRCLNLRCSLYEPR